MPRKAATDVVDGIPEDIIKEESENNVDDVVIDTTVEQKELNLDEKITIRNIAGWAVGFTRLADMHGDVSIPANGTTRLTRNEIIMQVQNGNKLFVGIDSYGSHATIYIEDAPTRIECDFESADGKRKQNVLTDEKVKQLFDYKTDSAFETNLKKEIVTRAEKYALIKIIQKLKINDYTRIKIVEKYTGYKFE